MEMETSSPLFVAQEFVRQYYRLDTNGNLAEPVNGQAGIHEKMVSLSERHTKIRHVDAHVMLNNGLVVQVLGELSISGQPMRKFMQTFVLAPEVSIFLHHLRHYTTFINVVILFLTEQ
uniref:NTF2 domain-containing protein n=1 Tax=Gouania willdenowi TaxID=441366 RepID=A0A8C5DIT1_GOUWI